MKRALPALLLLLPLAAAAQDDGEERSGFFGRLFNSTEGGPGFIEGLLEDNLSGAGREVRIEGFEGALSSRATIETLTIADDEGTWLTLRDVVLDWDRSAILRRRIEISELSAAEIELPRLPQAEPQGPDVPSPEAQGFSLPELPVSIRIDSIAADRVALGEPLFGAAAEVSLSGEVSLAGGEGATDITVERIDDTRGLLSLEASYDNETRELALDLGLDEGPDGIVANLIDLPRRPSLELAVEGAGPLSDFAADITLATDGEERLDGEVVLTGSDDGATSFRADVGGDVAPLFLPEYQEFFGPDVQLHAEGTRQPDGRLDLPELSVGARALTLEGAVAVGADGLPDLVDLKGTIASDEGAPVLLPLAGPETRVDAVTLDVAFDAEQGDEWQALIEVEGLNREGFSARSLRLDGSGRIATEDGDRLVTSAFDFAAQDLDLGDPAASAALGEEVRGRAEIDWREGEPVVIETLTVEGESYGLVASGTIDGIDSELAVTGEAELEARDLAAFSGLAGRPLSGQAWLEVSAAGEVLAGRFDLEANGTVEDLALGAPRLDPLLAGTGTLDLRTTRSEAGTALETFRLATDAVTVTADGRLATGDSDVRLDAELEDVGMVVPELSGPASLAATATEDEEGWTFEVEGDAPGASLASAGRVTGLGEAPVVEADLTADIDNLSAYSELAGRQLAGAVSFTAEGRTGFDLEEARLSLEASGQDLALGLPDIDPLLAGTTGITLDAERSGETLRIAGLTVDGEELDAALDGVVRGLDPEGAFDGTATITVSDLSAFSGLAGRDLGGAATVEAQGELAFDLSRFDVAATVEGTDIDPGLPGIDELLAGETVVTLDAAREGETVTIETLRVDGDALSADVVGQVAGLRTNPTFEGRASAEIDELAPLSELAGRDLSGAARAEFAGTAAFDLSEFDLDVTAVAQDLDPGLAEASAALDGEIRLEASARREGDDITLDAFELTGPQLDISAEGTLADLDTTPIFDGRLDASAADLAVFSGIAGRPLNGSLEAQLEGRAAADLDEVDVTVSATSTDLDLGLPGEAKLFPGRATLDLRAVREGEQVLIEALSLDSANLSANGGGALSELDGTPVFEGEIALSVDDLAPLSEIAGRALDGAFEAQASGRVETDLSGFDIRLDATGDNLQIGQPDVDRLLAGTTTLSLGAERNGTALTLRDARLDAPGLTATASGAIEDAITLNVRLADVAPFAPGFSGPATVNGTAALDGETVTLDLDATGPSNVSADIAGTVQTSFEQLDLSVSGQAPLALANRFIAPRSLDGTVRVDLDVTGPPALESVSGTITTQGARFVEPRFGIVLEDIGLTAQLAGGRVNLDAGASVQNGGTLSVEGPVSLTGNRAADLSIVLDGVEIRDPELYETIVNGQLSVSGPLTGGATIGGEIVLGETEISITSGGFGGAGAVPDIIHVNEPPGVRATRERAGVLDRNPSDGGQQGPAFPLDIVVRAENQIFVRGRGLDAELGGQLRLGGTTRQIIPAGQFDLIRGRLDILGERLLLDEGSIQLQGDFVPVIRLVAQTDAGDTTVFVIVEGSVREPEITFESQPELPNDEILARLLFGRDLSQISAFQAAQLASAVATLTGRGGQGVVGQLREGIGLDDLDVTTTDDGAAALRAGRYLSDNVYTDVTVDSEGDTEVNINLDLTPSITVRGGVGDDGGTSLGVFFERDY